jgi:hypothetical protein
MRQFVRPNIALMQGEPEERESVPAPVAPLSEPKEAMHFIERWSALALSFPSQYFLRLVRRHDACWFAVTMHVQDRRR